VPQQTKILSALLMIMSGSAGGVCLAQGQQGLESYALVHPFGLSYATTGRQFGMGGVLTCVGDLGFANPAFAATQEHESLSWRLSRTKFDSGLDLVDSHVHMVMPIRPHENGLQVTLFSLHTTSGRLTVPGVGPLAVDLSEEDISLQYGHRLSSRLTGGLGISPTSEIEMKLDAPGGVPVMHIAAESDYGARVGLAYEWMPRSYVGLVYDRYQETVKGVGIGFGGMTRQAFHTDLLALGVSGYATHNLLLAAEYQRGRSRAGSVGGSLCGWHFGAELTAGDNVALRAGLNDEQLTLGVGYETDRWRFDYAFVQDWNDDVAGSLFGGSDTHQLQAIYRW